MATVKNTYKLDPKDYYISKLMVNDGRMQERVFPRSRGRADKIQKRTSHITMELDQIKAITKPAKTKKEKPAKIAK